MYKYERKTEKNLRMDPEEMWIAYALSFFWGAVGLAMFLVSLARTNASDVSSFVSPISGIKAYEKSQDLQIYSTGEKPAQPTIVSASWYGQEYCDKYSPACIAADGSRFNDKEFTAACDRRWALGTYLRLSYNGKTVVIKCSDRGSFAKYGRSLDLSKASFQALAPLSKGIISVKVQKLK